MFWDDDDHCIYVDFFGPYKTEDKERIASVLITTNDELQFPYSVRIGFHETEKVARKTMTEWVGAQEPGSREDNQTAS